MSGFQQSDCACLLTAAQLDAVRIQQAGACGSSSPVLLRAWRQIMVTADSRGAVISLDTVDERALESRDVVMAPEATSFACSWAQADDYEFLSSQFSHEQLAVFLKIICLVESARRSVRPSHLSLAA